MTEDAPPPATAAARALEAALVDKDPPISFRLVRKGGKRGPGKWVIAEEGIQVHVPGWAVVAGLVSTFVAAALAIAKVQDVKLGAKGAMGIYGPDRVTLEDLDYARGEMREEGALNRISAMEWVVGVPMYARAHRDYRMTLADEVAAPSDAGVPDTVQAAKDNWDWTMFTLSTGEEYHAILIPFGHEDFPQGWSQEYWMDGGMQQSTEPEPGTRGAVLKAQAQREGLWPPRKLTAAEKQYGHAGPPA